MKDRVAIITPTTSQPRHHKRIIDFVQNGFDVTVYSFKRGLYEINTLPEGCSIVILGNVQNGKYLQRITTYIKAAIKIIVNEKRAPMASVFYAFGHDNIWLAYLTKRKKSYLVYEVGDITYLNTSGRFITTIIKALEQYILRKIDLLVLTSPWYLSEHYAKLYPKIIEKSLIVENKLSKIVFTAKVLRPCPVMPQKIIAIGFVGAFNHEEIFRALLDAVAQRKERYILNVYGDGAFKKLIMEYAESYDNIIYHGPYRSPFDLERIYRTIDLSFCVYDNTDKNVELAIPNKYFESLFFGIPLVVSSSTALAERVLALKGGFVVDSSDTNSLGKFLDNLDSSAVHAASVALLNQKVEELVDGDDVMTYLKKHC